MSAFPGIILAWKVFTVELFTYANHRLAAEGGTNKWLGKGAEIHENASLGAVLEAGHATGTAMDRFVPVKECAAELGTAAEEDACAGASAAA